MYLKLGSKGPDVVKLQRRLNALGYKLVVDGEFGKMTEAAVKSFQKNHNIAVDGIVGDKTWGALFKAQIKKVFTRKPPAKTVFLDVGHIGKVSKPDDLGASSGGLVEANVYMGIVKEIKRRVTAAGYNCVVFPLDFPGKRADYPERNRMASKANVYIQLHLNSGGGSYAVFEYITSCGSIAARKAADAWKRATGVDSRVKPLGAGDRGYICIANHKCGVIFEPYFIDNSMHQFHIRNTEQFTSDLVETILATLK